VANSFADMFPCIMVMLPFIDRYATW